MSTTVRTARKTLWGRSACAATGALAALALLSGCGVTGGGLGSAAGSAAPNAVPQGPQLGYVWRASDKTLRPLLGVAGSAQVGASVTPAGAFASGAASPGGMGVLIASDGALYTQALPGGKAVSANVSVPAGASIRFAPLTGAALIFTPGAPQMTLLTGWPGTVTAQVLNAGMAVENAALSDTGAVAFATGPGSGSALYAATATAAPRLIGHVGSLGGMSFVPGAADLLVTDSTANTLLRVSSVLGSASTATVPAENALHAPGAVSASPSGAWAVVANTGAQSVVRLSLNGTSAPQTLACACQPTGVALLAGGSAFRITELATGPLWLADAGATAPRLLFVPGLTQ